MADPIASAIAAAVAEALRPELDALRAAVTELQREPKPPKRLTTAQLAAAWQVSERHISNLRRRGMPVVMIGESPRYCLVTCEAWLAAEQLPEAAE